MKPSPVLEVRDLHTYYGSSHILQGVSLSVPKGSVAALLGRNGMGKTTLLHSIIGFVPPARGTVTYDGQDVTSKSPHHLAALGVALVPQGRRIFASLSVREN